MIEQTIANLKQAGLVFERDIVFACMDSPSQSAVFWGGAIGAAISQANAKRYIVAVSENDVRMFELNKETFELVNSYNPIPKEHILKFKMSSLFGSRAIVIKTTTGNIRLSSKNKFYGFLQKEQFEKLKEFLKSRQA